MLTTVLDLLGLAALITATLLAAGAAFGVVGLVVALIVVGLVALGGSWLMDRLAR